ncbi:unnamed protein product, partial [Rotaria sp. Silwood1]
MGSSIVSPDIVDFTDVRTSTHTQASKGGIGIITEAKAQCFKEAFASKGYFTITKKLDNTLWSFGQNSSGQLGDGSTVNKNNQVKIGNSTDWAKIAVGESHVCAIKTDGSLWAWGNNNAQQLGDSNYIYSAIPVRIGNDYNWKSISVGLNFTIAIKTDGSLWAWGDNNYGQLGNGAYYIKKKYPTQIGTSTNWSNVSAGARHCLAIKTDGSLWAWGYNLSGQLGNGTNTTQLFPIQIGTSNSWKSISAGDSHSVAIGLDSSLWVWGDNSNGQLGTQYGFSALNFPYQLTSAVSWAVVSAGLYHTVAIKADGTLWAWGKNTYGQVGDGTTLNKQTPTQIGSESNWLSVSAGSYHTCAIKQTNTLWSWGWNILGQLGDSTNINRNIPNPVNCIGMCFPTTSTYTQVSCDSFYWSKKNKWYYSSNVTDTIKLINSKGCDSIITLNLTIYITTHNITKKTAYGNFRWKKTNYNTSGTYTYSYINNAGCACVDTLKLVVNPYNGCSKQLSAGVAHSLLIKNEGTLWSWGYNSDGQLGLSTFNSEFTPKQVDTLKNWAIVSAGGRHNLAIKNNGTLWSWGRAYEGQLGNGSFTNKIIPTPEERP